MNQSVVVATRTHEWHESHELTWRRKTEGVEVTGAAPAHDRHQPTHSIATSAQARSSGNAMANNVNELRQLLAADSNFVGRLTDDVVRRIERSVRTDRARRGL